LPGDLYGELCPFGLIQDAADVSCESRDLANGWGNRFDPEKL